MSRSLFLGLGKSNLGLAKVIPGEKIGFVENDKSQIEIYHFDSGEFKKNHEVSGTFDDFDFKSYRPTQVFLSPGIDPRRAFMKELSLLEVRELDYVSRAFKGKIVAITGTDGKSTMTVQWAEVLRRAFPRQRIFVGGNLGTPMSDLLMGDYDWAVLEVSSFQAERLKSTAVDYGMIINLAPDHLDRYDSLSDYYEAKWNLIERSKVKYFPQKLSSKTRSLGESAVVYSNEAEVSEILKLAASDLLTREGAPIDPSWFLQLPRLPHRQEVWQDATGAIFVNDSKATTVHATAYALRHLSKEFRQLKWILGGRYKGDDFSILLSLLRNEDQLFVVGEARELIQKQLKNRGMSYASLKSCLENELSKVQSSDALVLSPACSSYDEFDNFEERGNFFLDQVRNARGEIKRMR